MALGASGGLPEEYQDQYNDQDWVWDDSDYDYDYYDYETEDSWEDTDSWNDTGNDTSYEGECSHPNGDVEMWWYEVDEETRDCYIDLYGEPWFID